MAICHNARKGRNKGSHWSKPVALPLYSTSIRGTEAEVILTNEDTFLLHGGSLIHNHPTGLPPSLLDYRYAIQANLKELRIVTPHGTLSVKSPRGRWPGRTEAERLKWWQTILPELRPALVEPSVDAQAHQLVVLFRQAAGASVKLE